MKKWILSKAIQWFPKERIAAIALNQLLDYADTKTRAETALKVVKRIAEAANAAALALEKLIGAKKIDKKALSDFVDSGERIAVKAWSRGEITPPESRHLKAPKDA